MLQPLVRRTWAPRGHTPLHYSWDRRDRLSVVSALTVSPQRRQLGLSFAVFSHNILSDDIERFLDGLLVDRPQGLTVVMDRWAVHRAAAARLRRRFPRRLCVEWLPPYAPDLNPVEHVWGHTKGADLANFIPEDTSDLRRSVHHSLEHTQHQRHLLRSFFQQAKLKL
jgi:transposase